MANEVAPWQTEGAASTPEEYIDGARGPAPGRDPGAARPDHAGGARARAAHAYGMLAYGRYHYRYESGREGDWLVSVWPAAGPTSRSTSTPATMATVPWPSPIAIACRRPYRRVCVRIKRLADLDEASLTELIRRAAATAGDHIES